MSTEFKNLPYPEFFVDESILKENDKIMSRSEINYNKMERVNTGNELFEAEDYYNSSDALGSGTKTSGSKNFDDKTYDGDLSNNNASPPKKSKKKLIIAIVGIVVLVITTVVLIIVFAPSSKGSDTNKGSLKGNENEKKVFVDASEINFDDPLNKLIKISDDEDPDTNKLPEPKSGDATSTLADHTTGGTETTKKESTSDAGNKDKDPKISDIKGGTSDKEGSSGTANPQKTDGQESPKVDPGEEKMTPGKTEAPEPVTDETNVKPDSPTLVRKHKYVLKQDPDIYNLNLDEALNPVNGNSDYDQLPKNQIKPEDIYDTKGDKFIYTKTYGNSFEQTKPFDFKYAALNFPKITQPMSKVKLSFNSAYYFSSDKYSQMNKVVYYDGTTLVESTDKLEYLTILEEDFPKVRLVTIVATPNTAGGINKQDRERSYIQYKNTGNITSSINHVITQDVMNNMIQVLNSIFK
ncbi:hypothetical protein MACJ_001250 [Theileria orientalis]|uniref:Uncharacterized protein n=1 Tax=Theileria orientalis TaxID=68886 RepID=A0A976M7V2_THEOR|nr:hypothetical protein MACJ_001250 [Theileria orientalis]